MISNLPIQPSSHTKSLPQIPNNPNRLFSSSLPTAKPLNNSKCKYKLTQSGFISSVARNTCTSIWFHPHPHPMSMSLVTPSSSSSASAPDAAQSSSSSIMGDEFKTFELYDVPDFHRIATPEGDISICGFGSLLSERSARSTFPDLKNFRVGKLKGFRRVFAHVAPIFFERGIAKPETLEISSLSVEPCEVEELIVTIFEIQQSEVPSFMERELEFRFLAVFPETVEGKPFTNPAVLCARFSDDEFFSIRCKGSKEMYHQYYGRYNIDKIWRDDILPCRAYLRHCVLAAKNLGEEAYNNFLDHTYLGDRRTTIRDYLATTGAGIMEEEPPLSLRARYGG